MQDTRKKNITIEACDNFIKLHKIDSAKPSSSPGIDLRREDLKVDIDNTSYRLTEEIYQAARRRGMVASSLTEEQTEVCIRDFFKENCKNIEQKNRLDAFTNFLHTDMHQATWLVPLTNQLTFDASDAGFLTGFSENFSNTRTVHWYLDTDHWRFTAIESVQLKEVKLQTHDLDLHPFSQTTPYLSGRLNIEFHLDEAQGKWVRSKENPSVMLCIDEDACEEVRQKATQLLADQSSPKTAENIFATWLIFRILRAILEKISSAIHNNSTSPASTGVVPPELGMFALDKHIKERITEADEERPHVVAAAA